MAQKKKAKATKKSTKKAVAKKTATKPKRRNQMSTSDLLVKESSGNTLANMNDVDAWGKQELSSSDIIIPRLLVMQGMSDMVTDGKAKFGEIVDNLEEKRVGGFDEPVEIIPFMLERVWRVQSAAGKGELLKTIPIDSNPASLTYNDNLPFEGTDEETGEDVKNYRAFRFYVLLASDVKEGSVLPYMIEFKSTSLKAGKKLATTMFTKNRAANLSPAAKAFDLSVSKQQNDQGTYAVFDVKSTRLSSKEEIEQAFTWYKVLNQGSHKVAEEE